MARVSCQVCGGRTEEGAFCEKCGAALQAGSAPGPAQAERRDTPPAQAFAAEEQAFADEAPSLGATATRTNDRGDRSPRVTLINREPEAERPLRSDSPGARQDSARFDECPWLCVERDTMAFCVAGANGLLRLRLTPQDDGLTDLRLRLTVCGAAGAVMSPGVWSKPRAGVPRELSLTIPPLTNGAFSANMGLTFVRDGRLHRYDANMELRVYAAECPTRQIAESLVVNITNDIKADRASDVHLSQNAADMVGKFAHNGDAHSLADLLNLMNDDMRAYRRLRFFEAGCQGGPVLPPPPAAALADGLTLAAGGRRVHLLAGTRVTLGRNRANRIVTRVFDGAGVAMPQLSERLSKFHCTLELDGLDCVIHDGASDENGMMKKSAWGVFWQGKAVPGCVRVPVERLPKPASLSLAGTADDYSFGLTMDGCFFSATHCEACEAHGGRLCRRGRIPALLLRRTDRVPELYALLWACLDLGAVLPECAGLVLCHEQGAFSWRSSDGAGWLTPGARLSCGIEAHPFAQFGL